MPDCLKVERPPYRFLNRRLSAGLLLDNCAASSEWPLPGATRLRRRSVCRQHPRALPCLSCCKGGLFSSLGATAVLSQVILPAVCQSVLI